MKFNFNKYECLMHCKTLFWYKKSITIVFVGLNGKGWGYPKYYEFDIESRNILTAKVYKIMLCNWEN